MNRCGRYIGFNPYCCAALFGLLLSKFVPPLACKLVNARAHVYAPCIWNPCENCFLTVTCKLLYFMSPSEPDCCKPFGANPRNGTLKDSFSTVLVVTPLMGSLGLANCAIFTSRPESTKWMPCEPAYPASRTHVGRNSYWICKLYDCTSGVTKFSDMKG